MYLIHCYYSVSLEENIASLPHLEGQAVCVRMGGGRRVAEAFTHPQRVRLLYKTILKLHRGLPMELKALGKTHTLLTPSMAF